MIYKIWDPFVRLFHWSVVTGFAANALFIDENSKSHEWIGYAVVVLVGLRILWGFIGPQHARFCAFLPRRGDVIQQVTDIATRRRRTHLGHSPLGALMILNLLGAMLAIGLTGWMMTTSTFWGIDWVEEMHEALVFWAELSIVAHIAAVVFESLRTGINLPRAMFTGCKDIPRDVKVVE